MHHLKPFRETAKHWDYREVGESELDTFMGNQRPDKFSRGQVGDIVAGMASVGQGLFSEVSHKGDRFYFELGRHWLWPDCGTLLRWGRFPSGKVGEARHPKKEANALYFFRDGNFSFERIGGTLVKKPCGTHSLCVLKSVDDYYFVEKPGKLGYPDRYYICDGLSGLLALIKSLGPPAPRSRRSS